MRVMTISLHTSPRGCPKPVSCLSAAEISFASRVILLENSSLWLLSASLRKEKALGFSLSSPRITCFIAKIPALSWVGGVFSLETCRHMLMLLLSYLLLWTCISFSSVRNLSKFLLVSFQHWTFFGNFLWQAVEKEASLHECTACWLFFLIPSFVMKKLLFDIHHLGSPSGEKTDWPALAGCQVNGSHSPFRDMATVSTWLCKWHQLLCPAGLALLQASPACLSLVLGFEAAQTHRCTLLLTTLVYG